MRRKLKAQIKRYRAEGYPEDNGLIMSSVILRRHNEPEIIEFDKKWWEEIANGSKRDQLSFNYIQWKTGLKYNFLEGDARDNSTFEVVNHIGK